MCPFSHDQAQQSPDRRYEGSEGTVGQLLLCSIALNASTTSWFTGDYARRHATISTLYEKAETSQWKAAVASDWSAVGVRAHFADLPLPRAGAWVLGWMDGAHGTRGIWIAASEREEWTVTTYPQLAGFMAAALDGSFWPVVTTGDAGIEGVAGPLRLPASGLVQLSSGSAGDLQGPLLSLQAAESRIGMSRDWLQMTSADVAADWLDRTDRERHKRPCRGSRRSAPCRSHKQQLPQGEH
jgi:hypothetical protein